MQMERVRAIRFALTMALACAMGVPALALGQQAEVARANELMRGGKAAEAFALLEPLEDKYAGNIEFDYALGVSALDSGKSDRATLALERVLAINPNFAGARLDMARAYFQLGDAERAKVEFIAVQQLNPPREAVTVIERYLEAIEQIERAKKRTLRMYVDASFGYDDNVNNSGTQAQINVPALGGLAFTLSPSNLKRSDTFRSVGAGADFNYQIRPDLGVFAGIDGRQRWNLHQDAFNNGSLDLRTGMSFGEAANQVRLSTNGGRYSLDDDLSRRTQGYGAEWRYTIDPANQINAFSQLSRVRFTSPATFINSFNQTTSGLGYMRVLNDGKAAIFGAGFFGKERDTEGRADGAKAFYGFRLGGQLMLQDNVDLFTVFSSQIGDYERQNAAFLAKRHDEQTDFVVGANWRFAKDWTLRPQLLHSRNSSSIVIYRYERTEASLTVRRDFN